MRQEGWKITVCYPARRYHNLLTQTIYKLTMAGISTLDWSLAITVDPQRAVRQMIITGPDLT